MKALTTPALIFLTDFGTSDWYVAAMKGRCLGIAPAVPQIDLTHEIPAGDIERAGFILEQVWRDFPEGAHFVCVVDPGVGTTRVPVAIEAEGRRFIGPDNGLFGFLTDLPHKARCIRNPKLIAKAPSQTFHGRDIFAPVAAHLAAGSDFVSVGPKHTLSGKPAPMAQYRQGGIEGVVRAFDHFGNALTNIPADMLSAPLPIWRVSVNERSIPIMRTFAEADPGQPLAYPGSSGLIEIAINRGNARDALRLSVGDAVFSYTE